MQRERRHQLNQEQRPLTGLLVLEERRDEGGSQQAGGEHCAVAEHDGGLVRVEKHREEESAGDHRVAVPADAAPDGEHVSTAGAHGVQHGCAAAEPPAGHAPAWATVEAGGTHRKVRSSTMPYSFLTKYAKSRPMATSWNRTVASM